MLPYMMGSYLVDKRYQNLGQRSELETWVGYSHVPFLGNDLNLAALFTRNPLAFIFNRVVLDSTKRHVAHFCYSLIDCNERTTGISENIMSTTIGVFPNPSNGNFSIKVPKAANSGKWNLSVIDIAGKEQYLSSYPGNADVIQIDKQLGAGAYFLKLLYEKDGALFVYTGKIIVTH